MRSPVEAIDAPVRSRPFEAASAQGDQRTMRLGMVERRARRIRECPTVVLSNDGRAAS